LTTSHTPTLLTTAHALSDLVEQNAVSLTQPEEVLETPVRDPSASTPRPLRHRISAGLRGVSLTLVAAGLIVLSVFAGRRFLVEGEAVQLTVDASPYATVDVLNDDNQSLYITACTHVFRLPMGVRGIRYDDRPFDFR